MAKSAEAMLQKWLDRGTSASASKAYKDGIEATTVNPMALAADAEQLYLQKVQEASQSGRRRNALLATPVSKWKANAAGKGSERLATGMRQATEEMRRHFQKWGPIYDQVSQAVASMPKGTREDSKARAARAIDMMMDAAGKS